MGVGKMETIFQPTQLSRDSRFLEEIRGNWLEGQLDSEYNPFNEGITDHVADMHMGIFHTAVVR
jgi:hypothetical protein